MSTVYTSTNLALKDWFKLLFLESPYAIGSAGLRCLLAVLILILSTVGCSNAGKPAPAKPGTVAHSWMTAEEAYKNADYKRTHEQIARLVATRTEYAPKAKIWALIVSAGVASGYRELADAYENGGRMNKAALYDYRKRTSDARRAANHAAMVYVESLHEFIDSNKDGKIVFGFDFPSGKLDEPLQLTKLNRGTTLQAADHEVLERALIERAVVRIASEVAGAPGDLEKARSQFKETSREPFLRTMAQTLYDNADLYSAKKLDEPRRLHVFCQEALKALATLPEGKEKKQLDSKIRDLMKKYPIKEA